MGLLAAFKESPLMQMVLSVTFVISGILVILLQLLTLFLVRPFSKRLYQITVCKLIDLHWGQLIWLCDHWSGTDLRIYADKEFMDICGKEHCVILCNHREDVDWLAIWVLASRFGILKQAKCLMKYELKYVPLVGWSFAMLQMIFVKRDFAKDKRTMIEGFRNYITYPLNCMILLYCEGTRFTPEKYAKSLEFARKNGLNELKHHLTPRTKGFVVAMEALDGQVPALYDLTFGVNKAESEPTLRNLLRGKKFTFNFHVKRIPISDVPKDEEGQVKFIHNIYKEKDKLYGHFVENDTFSGYDELKMEVMPWRWGPVFIEMFWFSFLGIPALYQLFVVVTSGSATATATAVGVIVALYFLVKYMIAKTVSSKGSQYGSNKHRNGVKDTNNDARSVKTD